MGAVFFPLDEALGLLGGKYTPRLSREMSRFGARMPFEQAKKEMARHYQVQVSEGTVRRLSYAIGGAAEALEEAEAARLEAGKWPQVEAGKQMMVSADGTFIGLTNGEWREVKSVAVGEYAAHWSEKKGELTVKTEALTYFSRSSRVREFELRGDS